MENIYIKIAKVKKEVGVLSKNTTNPFFKSKYFDINQLIGELDPLLEKNDLILLQPIINSCVVSKIIDIETGFEVSSEIKLPDLSDPQKIGSAITYYRRYALQSLLGLQADDDDANKASGNVIKNKTLTPKKELNILDDNKNLSVEWLNLIKGITENKIKSIDDVKKYYVTTTEIEEKIKELLNK